MCSMIIVARPMAATMRNTKRQLMLWPSQVPAGTPTTLASVSPENMLASAAASLPLSTRRVATTAPTPKNAPCGRPARKRNSSIV